MKITQSEEEIAEAATSLMRESVEGIRQSLDQFDAASPSRRPRSYMRFREALLMALSVLDATTSGNTRTAAIQLKTASRCAESAKAASSESIAALPGEKSLAAPEKKTAKKK